MNFLELLPIAVFFVLLLGGMEVAFSLAISGVVGLLAIAGPGGAVGALEMIPYRTAANFVLVSIGMFILMAEFATASGITKRLFAVANSLVGHHRGGLGFATVIAAAAFATLSGSSVAAAATISRISIPEMLSRGYSNIFAAGTSSIAGTLGIIIPPSIPLIVFGILTEISISKLLVAGIVPGILTAALYLVTIRIWTHLNPTIAPPAVRRANIRERWEHLRFVWPFLLVVVLVFGALYSGAATTTEVSAIGAAAVFIVWAILGRIKSAGLEPISALNLRAAFHRTLHSTVMIIVLLIGAYLFSFYIITTGLNPAFQAAVKNLDWSPTSVLLMVIGVYLVLGCFMSQLEIMVLTLPFIFPLMTSLGYDGIWFGIIVVKTIEIGLVTPPVGMNVYVVAATNPAVSVADGFKGIAPFLMAEVATMSILVVFPGLALYLPNLMN